MTPPTTAPEPPVPAPAEPDVHPPAQDPAGALAVTGRTEVRRHRDRASYDRELVHAVLDEALLCHVGFVTDHGPVVLPMAHVRVDDHLYVHGATGNAMLRALAAGGDVCVTVTLLDGLVLARSAFHHSMNYRSVVLFGRAERVTDPHEARRASAAMVDRLSPGRSAQVRAPSDRELRATLWVRVPVAEASAKVRTGGPSEEPEDLDRPVWAGHVPTVTTRGEPVPHVP